MAAGVFPSVAAGVAIAGAGFWLAGPPAPSDAPGVRLASVESVLAPPPLAPVTGALCDGLLCLFGPNASSHTPPGLGTAVSGLAAASDTDNPLSALFGPFAHSCGLICNGADGTEENPNG